MRRMYLVSTIVLLSTLWGMAQAAGQQPSYPNRTTHSNQSPARLALVQGSAPQPSSAIKHDSLLEGCIGGSSDSLTLTDAAGKVYQLHGDTAKLADHVGQHASLTGSEEQGSASGGAGAPPAFTVKKVAMIARTCSASK